MQKEISSCPVEWTLKHLNQSIHCTFFLWFHFNYSLYFLLPRSPGTGRFSPCERSILALSHCDGQPSFNFICNKKVSRRKNSLIVTTFLSVVKTITVLIINHKAQKGKKPSMGKLPRATNYWYLHRQTLTGPNSLTRRSFILHALFRIIRQTMLDYWGKGSE